MAVPHEVSTEARPHMSSGLVGFYVSVLLIGIAIFAVSSLLISASTFVPPPASNPTQATTGPSTTLSSYAKVLDNKLQSLPPRTLLPRRLFILTFELLRAFSLTLITVSLFEFLKYIYLRRRHRKDGGVAFEQFFGLDAVKYAGHGKIVIQASRIEEVSAARNSKPDEAELASDAPGLKAREQTNRWDVEGVKLLRNCFNDKGINVPDICIVHRKDQEVLSSPNEPFIITLGMGFIHQMQVEKFLDWFKIEDNSPWGDCLLLTSELVNKTQTRLQPVDKINKKTATLRLRISSASGVSVDANSPENFRTEEHPFEPENHPGFLRILPLNWDLHSWLKDPGSSQDYAIIYRHTHLVGDKMNPRQKVQLVVAGFTERSTAVGAKYLANRWPLLYENYVKAHLASEGRGDFLCVVGGASKLESFENWRELLYVTPQILPGNLKWNHLYIDPNGEPSPPDNESTDDNQIHHRQSLVHGENGWVSGIFRRRRRRMDVRTRRED